MFHFRYTELITESRTPGGIAHTRGRKAYKPRPGEDLPEEKLFFGKDVDIPDLIKSMEEGTDDVLRDSRMFKLSSVRIASASKNNGSFCSDYSDNIEEDDKFFQKYSGSFVNDTADDINEDDMVDAVSTPMGVLDRRSAEAFYLNGGTSLTSARARQSRFYYNQFDKQLLMEYKASAHINCCQQPDVIKQGDHVSLQKWCRLGSKRSYCSGVVAYMSLDNQKPIQGVCRKHFKGKVNVWLIRSVSSDFVRCLI